MKFRTIKHVLSRGRDGRHFYPGAWVDWEMLSCHYYYSRWGEFLLQQEYAFYPFGELLRLKNYLYKTFGKNNNIFIRPNTNDKVFTGSVVEEKHFKSWFDATRLPNDLMCIIAKPQDILAEYRFVMFENKVISGSQYKDGNCIIHSDVLPKESINFAEKVSSVWSPHPIYCLDLAETKEGFKVVECGSVNMAGFYKCNIKPIIEVMSKIAIKEFEDGYY